MGRRPVLHRGTNLNHLDEFVPLVVDDSFPDVDPKGLSEALEGFTSLGLVFTTENVVFCQRPDAHSLQKRRITL
jgi:hypothetical protein